MILWSLDFAFFSSYFSSLIETSKKQTFMNRILKLFLAIFVLSPSYFTRNVDITFLPSGFEVELHRK